MVRFEILLSPGALAATSQDLRLSSSATNRVVSSLRAAVEAGRGKSMAVIGCLHVMQIGNRILPDPAAAHALMESLLFLTDQNALMLGNSRLSRRDGTPFRLLTNSDMQTFGG
jgi:hypothetical protein